jgi:hypothetical protein
MGYAGGGVNGALRWRDLAMDQLLPVDEDKEEAKRAMEARKMASGASSSAAPQPGMGQVEDEADETEEHDENDPDGDDDEDEDEDTEGEDD